MAEIKGMQKLMRTLDSLGVNVVEELKIAVELATLQAASDARMLAPSNKYGQAYGSGAVPLSGSITEEYEDNGGEYIGRVVTNAPHAAFVEFGTGPVGAANHSGTSPEVQVSYTSREKWAYPYETKDGLQFATTSGQPARPYLYPAAKQNEKVFAQLGREALTEAIARSSK